MAKILSVNLGSSTLKWRLFEMPDEKQIASGLVDFFDNSKAEITVKFGDQQRNKSFDKELSLKDAIMVLMDELKRLKLVEHLHEIVGIGHRVVAGGEVYKESVVITKDVLQQIDDLGVFAPLHNHREVGGIELFRQLMPWTTLVAVFDSAFHQTMSAENYLYGIPYDYYKKYGARKYGAHGTSVRYVSKRTAKFLKRPLKDLRLIVMHLGAGSSITAVSHGKSLDTSMGFTPLDGVMMNTRSGQIDASLVLYLAQKLKLKDSDEMLNILNNKSGLLGVSGLSDDQRELKKLATTQPRAQLALDMYANRVIKFVGSYIALMNGVDALIFTGGVGENSFEMRAQIMASFSYVGATIDQAKNESGDKERDISASDARVKTMVVPTNEELMIARDVYARL
ncbi:Acetate kinase [Pediococcus damnosus]|uniref:Acetate kinase n=1 Tax=Pediococcus damnosus TaxID=51663 RepID=A0A0R2HUI9_9LACO|nr:acetate kinase [Pediococcus damnosus]AMV61045.1 Acetate kinase [Pediococcus damnosus]AMV63613.1 Acetate kinase [Pediococcus damnosus]AMV65405.1 Acetate kinase [Pediococcus damnosus]AMV66446.1 Acetate kinase [Pediococcus damnosus]AMV68748.1 Acetate kinase [Pediococcus damnosus]